MRDARTSCGGRPQTGAGSRPPRVCRVRRAPKRRVALCSRVRPATRPTALKLDGAARRRSRILGGRRRIRDLEPDLRSGAAGSASRPSASVRALRRAAPRNTAGALLAQLHGDATRSGDLAPRSDPRRADHGGGARRSARSGVRGRRPRTPAFPRLAGGGRRRRARRTAELSPPDFARSTGVCRHGARLAARKACAARRPCRRATLPRRSSRSPRRRKGPAHITGASRGNRRRRNVYGAQGMDGPLPARCGAGRAAARE
jgi:hypothetical protein